jgi:hypothetical protein
LPRLVGAGHALWHLLTLFKLCAHLCKLLHELLLDASACLIGSNSQAHLLKASLKVCVHPPPQKGLVRPIEVMLLLSASAAHVERLCVIIFDSIAAG